MDCRAWLLAKGDAHWDLCMQVMLDMQLTSMKAYNPANFGQDTGLHFITQRYALLTTSLLLLNADYQVRAMESNME